MNPLNENALLLLVGLIVLIINVVFGVVRLRQGHPKAETLNVVLVLVACAVITVGVVRISFAAPTNPANGKVAIDSQPGANGSTSAGSRTVLTSASSGSAQAGKSAADTVPESPAVGSRSATTSSPENSPINQIALLITGIVAVAITLGGVVLLRAEQSRTDYNPSSSSGLLNIGAGVFTLVAVIVIPMIPAQLAGGTPVASIRQATQGGAPTRSLAQTSTATITLTPSGTPTSPPTLTATPSETPIILYTPAAYTSGTGDIATPTNCTVIAQSMLNLRGDPSLDQRAIGRVFIGSLLPVTGRSTDGKWWRVLSSDGKVTVEGWVSADFVKADTACKGGTVPVITAGTLRAPSTSTATATASATRQAAGAASGSSATPVDCTIMTTSVASLRSGPSRAYLIVAQIPERVALTPIQKSTDNQWWNITYEALDGTTKSGWIGSGVVFVSASCAAVPAVTLTPTP